MSMVKQESAVFLSKVPGVIAELENSSRKWSGMTVTLQTFGKDSESPNVNKVCEDLITIGETVIKGNVNNLKDGFTRLEETVRSIAKVGGEV